MKKTINKKKETKKIIILTIAIIAVIAIIATVCIGFYRNETYKIQNPVATIEVEGYGTMKVELYPEYAKNTVNNFITLANNGFYDGLTFHRIIKDFMIQGGDVKGDGTGSPTLSDINPKIEDGSKEDVEYTIEGEFIINGYEKNTLKLEKGIIAMARADYSNYAFIYGNSILKEGYNSAGSQFFILTTDGYINQTGVYAGFGKVIEGFEVLEKIENTKIKEASKEGEEASTPVEPPVIKSIKVETFGEEYKMPEIYK